MAKKKGATAGSTKGAKTAQKAAKPAKAKAAKKTNVDATEVLATVVPELSADLGGADKPAKKARSKGGRTKGDSKPEADVKRAEQIQEALDYRKQGFNYRQIAESMGIAPSTAHDYVQRGLKTIFQESAHDVAMMMIERLDDMMQQLMPLIASDNAPRDVVDSILKLDERRMRLMGIAQPQGGIRIGLGGGGDDEGDDGEGGEAWLLKRLKADAPVLRPDGPVPASPVL